MRVVKANEQDLRCVLAWLEREYNEAEGEGFKSFWCNRQIIQRSFGNDNLWVIREKDEAIAFQVGNYAAEIACVRKEFQRRGLGKKLFAAALARAKRDNVNVLWGECAPTSSFPFWNSLGFEQYNDPDSIDILVRRFIKRRFKLPKGKAPAAVEIEFYPEEVLYKKGVPAVSVHTPNATLLEDRRVFLVERVMSIELAGGKDLVIKIKLDGIQRCFCKAKHKEAIGAGVQYDGPGRTFYVDVIEPSNS